MIAVVIPCYRVVGRVGPVLATIPPEVRRIYCVDDACPEGSGDHIEQLATDPRVVVLRHPFNQGVGGATMTGYRQAVADGATVVVKIDGDGQMDPRQLHRLVTPILDGRCDYAKGNRFFDIGVLTAMPGMRLFGNLVLSFLSKLSSGYWNVFDPTNGYTAIHAEVIKLLPLDKISQRFFFESDLLFRLYLLRCAVFDIPLPAHYGEEKSNLSIPRVIVPFLLGHGRNLLKRLLYVYFLRDFSVASVELVAGVGLSLFGLLFGAIHWYVSASEGAFASAGTVMVSALPLILGFQLLLAALNFDVASVPRHAIHPLLRGRDSARPSE